MTLPLDPSTFPNRTDTQRIPFAGREETISSPSLLVAPMILVGLTALSDEISTKFLQPVFSAKSNSATKPSTLFFTASCTFHSIIGTCLYAAAWNMINGLYSVSTFLTRDRSQISATQNANRELFGCP